MDEVFADPQVAHLDIAQPVDHPRRGRLNLVGQPLDIGDSRAAPRAAAPDYGADTDAVLAELGLAPGEIAELRALTGHLTRRMTHLTEGGAGGR